MAWSDLWRMGRTSGAEPRRAPVGLETDHAYLCVRSVAADGERHLMQYAVADDLGSVLLSVFVRSESPVGRPDAASRAAVAAGHALDSQGLAAAMRLCRGLRLTAFGAGLSRGLLPPDVAASLAGLDCARERFLKVARLQGLRLAPGEPADLNEARRLVGLPPERSDDAALRALALGGLCRWMREHAPLGERRSFLG